MITGEKGEGHQGTFRKDTWVKAKGERVGGRVGGGTWLSDNEDNCI